MGVILFSNSCCVSLQTCWTARLRWQLLSGGPGKITISQGKSQGRHTLGYIQEKVTPFLSYRRNLTVLFIEN